MRQTKNSKLRTADEVRKVNELSVHRQLINSGKARSAKALREY